MDKIAIGNNKAWAFNRAGNGDRTILFLHGFPDFSYMWRNQINFFQDRYLCIAPDLTGYNQSSKPNDLSEYSLSSLVKDLESFIEALSLEKIILVSHDWGGILSWILAANNPFLIEKMVIINSPHPALYEREIKYNPEQQKSAEYVLAFRRNTAEKLLARKNFLALDSMFISDGLDKKELTLLDKNIYHASWSSENSLTSMLNYYRATKLEMINGTPDWNSFLLDESLITNKLHVDVETMIIWGANDKSLVQDNLNGIEKYVSNCEVVILPDNSHWVVHESPNVVNKKIEAFIE